MDPGKRIMANSVAELDSAVSHTLFRCCSEMIGSGAVLDALAR